MLTGHGGQASAAQKPREDTGKHSPEGRTGPDYGVGAYCL